MAPSTRHLLTACLAALLCSACGDEPVGAPETLVDKALEANARQQAAESQAADGERKLTLETEAGLYRATSGDNLSLPADFPADVPLPRDASITNATQLGATISLGAHSPRSLALVFDEFRRAQRAAGWTEATVQADAIVRVAGFDKAGRHLEANFVEEAGGGTTLAVTVGPAGD
ncbi:hypothetical protein GCM10011521_20740 [Arenimonas soli]|uniref:Lipoprotein n=1 Tax=Arenimonas soli TaxID=2269504 RepID=A0ABQ1HMM1_9GAMM|nr:hypothetical protein [Arenimonas soli]GGA82226.1 hypothetical protein GCM10011521_20740 [Arenimonas soli]